jgi:hypothetical protein
VVVTKWQGAKQIVGVDTTVAIDRFADDSDSVDHRLIRWRETSEILLANQII